MSLEAFVKQSRQIVQDNSPSILAALAVGGVFTTALVAYNVGYETGREMESESGFEPLTGKEKFQRYWKSHLPIFILGATTVACTIGGTVVSNRRNAILGGSLAVTEAAYREYQDKVEKVVTKPKREQIETELAQEKLDKSDNEVIYVGDGDILLFDTLTSRTFKSSKLNIEKAEVEIGRKLLSEMYVSQNEWYDEIGLPRISTGDDHGWNHDLPLQVKFIPLERDDKPVLGIDYHFRPSVGFDRFG